MSTPAGVPIGQRRGLRGQAPARLAPEHTGRHLPPAQYRPAQRFDEAPILVTVVPSDLVLVARDGWPVGAVVALLHDALPSANAQRG
jgi:hypothetical protein